MSSQADTIARVAEQPGDAEIQSAAGAGGAQLRRARGGIR